MTRLHKVTFDHPDGGKTVIALFRTARVRYSIRTYSIPSGGPMKQVSVSLVGRAKALYRYQMAAHTMLDYIDTFPTTKRGSR